jgi:hypothetical protein
MACLNRELVDCNDTIIATVKQEVYDLEVTYREWLVAESQEDETCLDACSSSPCDNQGICVVNATYEDGFYCECIEGFEGDHCEIREFK